MQSYCADVQFKLVLVLMREYLLFKGILQFFPICSALWVYIYIYRPVLCLDWPHLNKLWIMYCRQLIFDTYKYKAFGLRARHSVLLITAKSLKVIQSQVICCTLAKLLMSDLRRTLGACSWLYHHHPFQRD